uniref:Uncharacterized protein n=1 Tax=Coccidioides posadasii RMSCC 3488 TaxID=454284 RepID=A0A0J6FDG2_COCPO|nr:hypothetical protein CPAG_07423 [Coccidioides posadasii RMSCC 3488]
MAASGRLEIKSWLLRSDVHDTTIVAGKHVKDTKGWHGIFVFKDDNQVEWEFHVALHGYMNSKEDFSLKEATHTPEKKDSTSCGGAGSGNIV